MSLSPSKTWIAGETLTAAELNSEFANILNNPISLISPLVAALDADGKEIILDSDGDTSITADTDDQIDIRIAGSDDFTLTANKFDVLAGSTLKVTGIETLTKGADVTAATDLLVNIDGNIFDVTGATTIATIATKGIGTVIKLHFDAALTLTHHATNLVLPGGANILTAAGDEAEFYEYASADWRCTNYTKATGGPVKEFYVYVAASGTVAIAFPYDAQTGGFSVATLGNTEEATFLFAIPADFTTLIEAIILSIPDTSETIQFDIDTSYGASGEASDANTETETDTMLGVTIALLTEIDASGVLSGIAANDYVGMEFDSDTGNIRLVALRIRYN